MDFSASITHPCALQTNVPRTMYVRTNVPTPPALCLGTPVPRQKPVAQVHIVVCYTEFSKYAVKWLFDGVRVQTSTLVSRDGRN